MSAWLSGIALPWLWVGTGFFLLLSLLLMAGLQAIAPNPPGTPSLVAFELAGTPARARAIRDSWGAQGEQNLRRSLWLDFAFMPAYAGLFALASLALARTAMVHGASGALIAAGLGVAAGAVPAAGLDAIENLALLGGLKAPQDGLPPRIAQIAAAFKFGLLGLAAGYWLWALAWRRGG